MRSSSNRTGRFRRLVFTRSSLAIAPFVVFAASATAQSTTRETVDARGFEVVSGGFDSKITPDGRFVVFASVDPNLVQGDTNANTDIFRRDRSTGEVVLVSRSTSGLQGSSFCAEADVSADGRYVVFQTQSPEFMSEGDLDQDVFVRDITAGTLRCVSNTSGSSLHPSISADGRYVAFASTSASLVAGDTNNAFDIFVYDLQTSQTTRVSVASNGAQADSHSYHTAISGDGRFVAFESVATNLVAGPPPPGSQQIYVHDVLTGATELVSQAPGGAAQAGYYSLPSISADGRFVTLLGQATSGINSVLERDRLAGQSLVVVQATPGTHTGGPVPLSADGRYVAFVTDDSTLHPSALPGATCLYVRDMQNGAYASVAIKVDGTPNSGERAAMSDDGRYVTFTSSANNLVIGDTHANTEVFVRDMTASGLPKISTYCEGKINSLNCTPKISASGRATVSGATTLLITATKLINQSNGLLFWGLGAQATPFQGGTMCVSAPRQRTPVQNSGGSSTGVDCSGRYSFDFDANYIAAHGLSAGMFVHGQYYQRDVGLSAPDNVGLSNAIKFPINP